MDFSDIKRFCGHAHSMYSNIRLIDCINKPKDLILKAYELGLSGIALTDHECLGGHVQWLKAEKELKEENKIPKEFKCALGNEIYLVEDRNNIERYWHYILIAKNTEGHRALRELSSIAWLNGFNSRGMMRVPTQMDELEKIVKKYPNSLISTIACIGGYVGNRTIELVNAEEKGESKEKIIKIKRDIDRFIRWNLKLFGEDFYFELAAGRSEEQIKFNKRIKSIAKAYNGKLIIGDDAHYLAVELRPIHKAYLNSKEGEREVDAFYAYSYLMSNEEAYNNLKDIYSKEEFLEMCKNSYEIQNKIESYDIFHQPIIPHVEVKFYPKKKNDEKRPTISSLLNSDNDQERYWINQCLDTLKEKNLWTGEYLDRIEKEASIIKIVSSKLNNCMFEYFNTFQHYIDLFWKCGSMVGPGRGSSVCFLTNYLLGITQLDPVKWNLKEWRFLNEDRLELPDIDVDLNPTKRKKIFEEIRKERGELNLIQVCTFGTEGTRSSIQASCRGYRSDEYPNGIDVDEALYISSLIPIERGVLWSINDCIYGNKEKNRKPIQPLINELNKFPCLLEIIQSIEGLICKRGQHASGVMMYNNSPFETNAIMRSPNGDLTTQFDLHDSETLGDTKFDFLVTEICDKITICIKMLQKDNLFKKEMNLRQIYNKYLHPSVIDLNDENMWNALDNGEVLDVFQFSTGVGLNTAKKIKPKNPTELTSANALMRLMGEEGEERPMDRYCRLKDNMQRWYQEVKAAGLTKEEIEILEPYYLPNYGVPCAQEDLMEVCMDKNIAHFTLAEANYARKVVAKKKMDEIPILKEKFISQCPRRKFGEYVWKTIAGPQMGYSFSTPHALSYSFVGIITLYLAIKFPSVYWNCACLIVNAGSAELLEQNNDGETNSANYGKISKALGISKNKGINILPPNINKSGLTFEPEVNQNAIVFGFKGIDNIGDNLVKEIIAYRPYHSMDDFLEKIKASKTQMFSLIKSGAFDTFYSGNRKKAMEEYIYRILSFKKKITLQNIPTLIKYDLVPTNKKYYIQLFNYNKYLKENKEGDYYVLNEISSPFYHNNFDIDLLTLDNSKEKILTKEWDKIYKKEMNKMTAWIKENQDTLLNKINQKIYEENIEKYASGNISKWEMESLGTYCHDHELKNIQKSLYKIDDFDSLKRDPEGEEKISSKGRRFLKYKIYRICGTIIDKDKNKSIITLLSPEMSVVNVKMRKEEFSKWDRQISKKEKDGTKTILEKSFLARGEKVILSGFRREDDFVFKNYIDTPYPPFEKIILIDEEGIVRKSETERRGE